MKSPGKQTTKVLATIATPLALVGLGATVYQASTAAFTGQTRNSGNEWSTGSVKLTDDDLGQARFQVANMLPDDTDAQCIKVTADASVASVVKGYAINPVTSAQRLEDHVMVTIESGAGGTFATCSGFTPDAGGPIVANAPLSTVAASNSFATAMGGWAVAPGVSSKTYRITWRFDVTGMSQGEVDRLQGAKTGIDIQWEMQSTVQP